LLKLVHQAEAPSKPKQESYLTFRSNS